MKTTNNTILITGGGSGIGLAFAEKFLALGNEVVICGRDAEKLAAAKKRLQGLHVVSCDLTSREQSRELVNVMHTTYPALNMLVNNAGIQHNYRFTDGEDHWSVIDAEVDANLTSHIRLTDALLPLLGQKQESAVVNVSSALSRVPKESAPVYCATKAGIHLFSKALRYQLENTTTKVFEVVPALVDTAMTAGRGHGKISPAAVAEETVAAMARDKFYIRIGKTKLLFALHRLLPGLADSVIRKG